ncbi:MAG: tetratricopeptide repeat protein, partial [Spirochaetes bacterium]|nr:tetratricopeptide repeat protein [Spirochaetota bacterium]
QPAKGADAKALYDSGLSLLASGETYRAVDAFTEALAVNPAYADAWAALARCQYDLGEYERAVAFVKESYRTGPRSPSLVTLEGFALVGLGRLEAARAAFDEALARLPNDRDARFGLALLDLRTGKPRDAKARLSASLKSAPRDPRALLSLALISKAEGRVGETAAYLAEALKWTSGDADACYAAAALFAEQGDAVEAARLAGAAVEARPSHAGARGLLASLYYESGALDEARSVLDGSLRYDRSDPQAWFLLGLVEAQAGRRAEAEYALSALAALRPDDELARIALENLVMDATGFEDPSRAGLAAWRFARAADFERRLLYGKAIAEYRRGLSVDPYANQGRRRYAELLRGSKLPASYLSELRFLSELGKADRALSDAIEIYDSLLEGSVARDWKAGGGAPPSRPYRVAVFSVGPGGTPYHAGSDMVIARYLRDALAFEPGFSPERSAPRVPGFSDAFRLARESGADYFVLVGVAETERDVIVSAELRAARTGALAARIEAPRSGNDRVALAVARIVGGIRENLEPRGTLLERKGNLALVDLGRVDGVSEGDAFLVVRAGAVSVRPDGSGLAWNDADVVARIVAKRLDDELFEGSLERVGFFDRVNPRDVVVREPPKPEPPPPGDKPAAKPAAAQPQPEVPTYVWSALFERVRSLY